MTDRLIDDAETTTMTRNLNDNETNTAITDSTAQFARDLTTYGSRRIGDEILADAVSHTELSSMGDAHSRSGEITEYDVVMRDGRTRRLVVTTYVSIGEDADVDMEASWS